MNLSTDDLRFLEEAYQEAVNGQNSGGIPIGAVLVVDGEIKARGHNKRIQENSMIKHGETDCFENTQRKLTPEQLHRATLYTSLSPCFMCAGTAMLFGVKRIVVGENETFQQSEHWLTSQGCEVVVANDPKFVTLMVNFIRNNPTLWGEDIGKTGDEVLAMYRSFL